jgi:hypothetical protein
MDLHPAEGEILCQVLEWARNNSSRCGPCVWTSVNSVSFSLMRWPKFILTLSCVTSVAETARNADDAVGTTRRRSVDKQVSWGLHVQQ